MREIWIGDLVGRLSLFLRGPRMQTPIREGVPLTKRGRGCLNSRY